MAKGWKLQWVECGTLSMGQRITMLKQVASNPDLGAAFYVHLTLTPEQAEVFSAAGLPLGCLASKPEGAHWVATDEASGGAKVAAEFARHGHSQFAIVSGPEDVAECREREAGFIKEVMACGHPASSVTIVRTRGFSPQDGFHSIKRMIPPRSQNYPSAIFCAAGDLVAQGAIQALGELNLSVPAQVSVCGYDNLPFCETMTPPLSTVRQPMAAMASRLFRILDAAASNPGQPLSTQLISPIFISRKSSAAAHAKTEAH